MPTDSRCYVNSRNSPNHNIVTIKQVSSTRDIVNKHSDISSLISQIVNFKQYISISSSNFTSIKKNKGNIIVDLKGVSIKRKTILLKVSHDDILSQRIL